MAMATIKSTKEGGFEVKLHKRLVRTPAKLDDNSLPTDGETLANQAEEEREEQPRGFKNMWG